MKIFSVYDDEFRPYGKVLKGYDVREILEALEKTPCTENVVYVASDKELEKLNSAKIIEQNVFGGMPVQLGYCNGHNTKLNCLEYHRDSELNLGTEDFILLLAKEDEIDDNVLDTEKVKAFKCPKGVMIDVFATTLHYAPCSAEKNKGFRTLVVLPRGTNGEKPKIDNIGSEDKLMTACNKWLLAHKDSAEGANGAYIGLKGENIDIVNEI